MVNKFLGHPSPSDADALPLLDIALVGGATFLGMVLGGLVCLWLLARYADGP